MRSDRRLIAASERLPWTSDRPSAPYYALYEEPVLEQGFQIVKHLFSFAAPLAEPLHYL